MSAAAIDSVSDKLLDLNADGSGHEAESDVAGTRLGKVLDPGVPALIAPNLSCR